MRSSVSIDLSSIKVGLDENVKGTDTPALIAEADAEVSCVVMGIDGVAFDGRSKAYGLDRDCSVDLRKIACGGVSSMGMIFDSFFDERRGNCCRGCRCDDLASLFDCAFVPSIHSLVCWKGFTCK